MIAKIGKVIVIFICVILISGVIGYIALRYYDNKLTKEVIETNKKLEVWKELSDEEKISAAEKIIIVSFSNGENNLKVATISKVYSKKAALDHELKEGNPYPPGDYYPLSEHENRSATIFLFMDYRDMPTTTWHVYDNKIPAVGNMPIEQLISRP